MFKLIVAGSRNFNNYDFLKEKLDYLLMNINDEIEIVSGRAKGADLFGEAYAKERGYKIAKFPADWTIGKTAGFIRNEDMAKYSNACVVFSVNNSSGSKHMIKMSEKYNLKLRIYKF